MFLQDLQRTANTWNRWITCIYFIYHPRYPQIHPSLIITSPIHITQSKFIGAESHSYHEATFGDFTFPQQGLC
jgi:hypothetical protein